MKKNNSALNKNLIEGIVLTLLSSFLISESLKLRGAEALELSPALFPLIITLALMVFSIVLTIRSVGGVNSYKENSDTRESSMEEDSTEASDIKPVILVILASFIYLIILSRLHFIISSVLYLLALLLILGERRWKVFLPIAIITPVSIFFIFTNLLDVLLP
nr:tripartite tricarboxylate transporter TctB family protein [Tissierella sp.]